MGKEKNRMRNRPSLNLVVIRKSNQYVYQAGNYQAGNHHLKYPASESEPWFPFKTVSFVMY